MRSKPTSVVINESDSRRRMILRVLGGICMLAAIALSFFSGYRYGIHDYARITSENLSLKDEKAAWLKGLEETSLKLSVAKHGNEVTRIATEQVRVANRDLLEEILELEELLALYRGVMSPDKNKRGLKIERFNLERIGERRYHFDLILAQIADHRRYIDGKVSLNLMGEKNGIKSNLALYLKIKEKEVKRGRFRFRYFQKFSGEVVIPLEFEPRAIKVTAKSKGKHAVKISREFAWGA